MNSILLKAPQIFPVDKEVLHDGAIRISNGLIEWIGPAGEAPEEGCTEWVLPEQTRILPGFVNTHCHLHHSILANQLELGRGIDSLLELSKRRRELDYQTVMNSVRTGALACLSAGITTLATNTPVYCPDTLFAAASTGLRVYGFLTLKPYHDRDHYTHIIHDLINQVDGVSTHVGIFVHSLMGFTPCDLQWVRQLADELQCKLALHLGEWEVEAKFFTGGHPAPGEQYLWNLLEKAYANQNRRPTSIAEAAAPLLMPGALVIHGGWLSRDDIDMLAERQVSVAVCPKSTHLLGNRMASVRLLKNQGVNVTLGTDSAATCLRYDMLAEMEWIMQQETCSEVNLLEMATYHGALALGLAEEVGTLTPGKHADMVVLHPIYGVLWTLVDGRIIHTNPSVTTALMSHSSLSEVPA